MNSTLFPRSKVHPVFHCRTVNYCHSTRCRLRLRSELAPICHEKETRWRIYCSHFRLFQPSFAKEHDIVSFEILQDVILCQFPCCISVDIPVCDAELVLVENMLYFTCKSLSIDLPPADSITTMSRYITDDEANNASLDLNVYGMNCLITFKTEAPILGDIQHLSPPTCPGSRPEQSGG